MQPPRRLSLGRKRSRRKSLFRTIIGRQSLARTVSILGLLILALTPCGCTSLQEYIHNGFKVGPNYRTPAAPVAASWIDDTDKRVRKEGDDLSKWWQVFNDPVLDALICDAYRQNLTLRQAGLRVLEARAQLGIAVGNLFPQEQAAGAAFTATALSLQDPNVRFQTPAGAVSLQPFYMKWSYPLSLGWEVDFWGRFRRAIEAGAGNLDASVADYDDVLVTLLSDVATNYVLLRTFEQQIAYAKRNVELQRETLTIVEARVKAKTISALDLRQARSTLKQTHATVPELEIGLRQANNQLCILLGLPQEELRARLGPAPIPTAPADVAAGIPADLLQRRPDVRRAERRAAAQSAQIGVAEADFYPHISIVGTIGYSAAQFAAVYRPDAFFGNIGPSVQWNILNYGRIRNNVRLQRAKFEEAVAFYQNAVLKADQEAENGLVTFLRAQERAGFQDESVNEALEAVKLVLAQYKAGTVDFTRVTQLEQNLVQQQNTLAEARGEIARGLIQVYRALGGGWQMRLTNDCHATLLQAQDRPPEAEEEGWPLAQRVEE
jgi:NodT family efflux transporter outer membrane factor (OMF) lipoprotein